MSAATSIFGSTVIYTPSGGSAITIKGIYRDQYLGLDSQTGYTIATERPHVSIRNSDLSFKPKQGDTLQVENKNFKVTSVQKDGDAGTIIFLHKLSDSGGAIVQHPWSHLSDGVMRAATNIFGSEVVYTPAIGAPITIQGIYRDQYLDIDTDTGYQIATEQPHISIRDLDFGFIPKQGDLVDVKDRSFTVISVQKDGEAGTIIFLHELES